MLPLIPVQMPIHTYIQNRLKSKTGTTSFDFPVLELYDRSGVLIYSKTGEAAIERLLADLPRRVPKSEIKGDPINLADEVAAVPAWNAQKNSILGAKRYTVVSIGLVDCPACTNQQSALEAARSRLLKRNVAVLALDLHADVK